MKIDNLVHVLDNLHKILLHLNEIKRLGLDISNSIEPTFKYNSITGDGYYIIEYTYETDPDFYPLTLRIYPTNPIGIHDISSVSLDPDGETSIEYNNDSKPEFYIDDIKKLFTDDYVFQQSTVHDVGGTNGQFWNTCYYRMAEICKLLKGDE